MGKVSAENDFNAIAGTAFVSGWGRGTKMKEFLPRRQDILLEKCVARVVLVSVLLLRRAQQGKKSCEEGGGRIGFLLNSGDPVDLLLFLLS